MAGIAADGGHPTPLGSMLINGKTVDVDGPSVKCTPWPLKFSTLLAVKGAEWVFTKREKRISCHYR